MNNSEMDPAAWLRRYTPAPQARTRLVCFPHAGGSASFFFPLATALAPEVDVISLQYPGRQDRRREPLVPDVEECAALITAALATLPPVPTVLFGHSLGALLAFEVALRQESAGAGPSAVVVSGRRGPGTVRDEAVHLKDDNGLIAEIKALDGTNLALLGDEEILRMALPAIRSDFRAAELYTCPDGRLVSCSLTVLLGADDPKSTIDEAREWEQHTTGAFRMEVLPGGHFYLTTQAPAVIRQLRTELDAARPVLR